MAFADLFSAPAKSSGSSSSGFGSLFASAPADQVAAQQQKSAQISQNTAAAKANYAQNGGIGNILKNTILGLPSATGIGQMAAGSFKQATGALTDAATGKSTTGGLKEGLDLVTGVGGVAFSPFAPVINPISKAISYAVNAAGNQVAKIPAISSYGRAVANIPNYDSQQETATKILQVLNSAGNASMALLGAKGGETAAKAAPELPNLLAEHGIEPKAPVAAETPRTAPVAPETAQVPHVAAPEPVVKGETVPVKAEEPMVDARTAKAAHDINETIVQKGYEAMKTEDLPKVPVGSYKASADYSTKLLDSDFPKARDIATGKIAVPPELTHSQILFNAVEAHAMKTNDIGLLRDLAKSPLATQSSEAGATLGSHGFNDNPHSAVSLIREVEKVRREKVMPKVKEAVNRVRSLKRKGHTVQTWSDFVSSIEC